MNRIVTLISALVLAVLLSACSKEEMSETVDEVSEAAEEVMEDAADAAEEAYDDAAEEVEEAVN